MGDAIGVKLAVLADAAKYDASCAGSGSRRKATPGGLGDANGTGICHSFTPDGRCVSLLKILLTNHCIYDCAYCVNRVSSDTPRARFTVAEVVDLTMEFYRRNYVEGLFLSSGVIRDPDYTMEQLAAVGRSLRLEHRFNGYIHLKAVPGASAELLHRAGLYADRLSANIELPTETDLRALAPQKKLSEVHEAMGRIKAGVEESAVERRKHPSAPRFAPAGQSTQLIVGATASTDATILATADSLYGEHRLRRVYYSAYSPIPASDDRLPARPPPLAREHRLYQADWLMRFYGFGVGELTTAVSPNLDLSMDPKLAWALRNRGMFPVDINAAPREMLLRVPGLGVRTVNRIVQTRRVHRLRLADLRTLRIPLNRARPFVVTVDHNPATAAIDRLDLRSKVEAGGRQMMLFGSLSGEL